MGTPSIKNNNEGEIKNKEKEYYDKNFSDDNKSNIKREQIYINKPEPKFQIKMLEYHNIYRKRHNSKEINLTKELSDMASKYAEKLLEHNSDFEQNNFYKNQILGENILFSEKRETEEDICNSWYDEKKNYDYSKNNFQKDTNHFTQLIWNSTTHVGFGCYNIGKNYCYVALYYPQGNILGKFTENVSKAKQ